MTLAAGSRLGPYEIVSPLGAGGMGEVYRARDTRLERDVAIKVLPEHLSSSPDIRQRFEREAKTVSQLSHPHICALYDVGREGETEYLVMELVEGETLTDRLAKGPLPLEQTLRFGREIAGALEAAHRQGIVHRDLKPGNAMLTKTGVKLLDFGLAKVVAPGMRPELTSLPTQASPVTQAGTVLGTFQYMAPEQLEGKEADSRTDIFALGCVLYEMATGKKAFEGKNQASLITAIMSAEPASISSIQPMTPPALDRVVKTCLAKDPEERWQSAGDVGKELKWIAEGSAAGVAAPVAVASRRRSRERIAWALCALLLAAAGFSTWVLLRRPREETRVMRFQISPPGDASFNGADGPATLSPDGRRMVYGVRDSEGSTSLWVRELESLEPRRLEGTEETYDPFWSPDGRHIAFGGAGGLHRTEASGGPVQPICDMTDGRGGDWNRDDVILFTTNGASPILRVAAAGGKPVPVTTLDTARGEIGHWRPRFLPDGRRFLFLIRSTQPENGGLAIGSLDSKEIRHLPGIDATAAWSLPGYLLFVRQRTLMAQPFDLENLRTTGEPFPIAAPVEYVPTWGSAGFSVSANGILAYQGGGRPLRRLVWFDRSGKELGTLGEPAEYVSEDPRISPDGRRVAVVRLDPESRSTDVWVYDVSRGVGSRLTVDPGFDESPVWSPDGSRIAFNSNRGGVGVGDLYVRAASGAGSDEPLLQSERWKRPVDWSRDGRWLLYVPETPQSRGDLWVLPLLGERKPEPVVASPFSESEGRFSPDGRWIAYVSNESGKQEVYVQPFPATGEKWQVSTAGGSTPLWRADGKELFYVALDYMRRAVSIRTVPTFEAGVPQDLFRTPSSWGSDVTSDGRRFLVNLAAGEQTLSPITVVLNWTEGLEKKP